MTIVYVRGVCGSGKSYLLSLAAQGATPKRRWWQRKAQPQEVYHAKSLTPYSLDHIVREAIAAKQMFIFFDEGTPQFCDQLKEKFSTQRVRFVVAGEML